MGIISSGLNKAAYYVAWSQLVLIIAPVITGVVGIGLGLFAAAWWRLSDERVDELVKALKEAVEKEKEKKKEGVEPTPAIEDKKADDDDREVHEAVAQVMEDMLKAVE